MLDSFDTKVRFIKHVIKSTHSYIKHVIKNGDYDWDFSYIYRLLRWKLVKVRDDISNRNIIAGADRVAKQINYAVYLIDELLEDKILPRHLEALEEKWGEFDLRSEDITDGRYVPPGETRIQGIGRYLRPSYPKAFTKEQFEQAERDRSAAYHSADKEYADKKKRLFRHLERYIEGWWD